MITMFGTNRWSFHKETHSKHKSHTLYVAKVTANVNFFFNLLFGRWTEGHSDYYWELIDIQGLILTVSRSSVTLTLERLSLSRKFV